LGELVKDLQAGSEALIETHISWVFLGRHEVFKVKKPVDFGFLDFTELSSRERACRSEVELNARLAPGVYLGVVPVTRGQAGEHVFGGSGEVVDFAVRMRRLPVEARADLRLEADQLRWEEVEALAVAVAGFHARAERGPRIGEHGSVRAIARNVEENFVQANAALRALVSEATEREIEERQLAFLAQHPDIFERRVASDRICDGHGDLRLEHVYFTDRASPIVIDCIEFNERFRFADTCADVAFLSMDLAFYERVDLKERFLAAYARESHDYELYSVVDFYESYRAYVRAKVNALSLASAASFEARQRLERQARRYLLLALAAERPAFGTPRLIAVGGIIASGKSTFADALGADLGVPVISSDRTRKALLGVEPLEPLRHEPWQRGYAPELTTRVYEELMRLSRVVLQSGRSVVLDATFASRQSRSMARATASELSVPFCFVECRVPQDVARARLRERASGASVSDGRLEIFDQFLARYEGVTELEPTEHFIADTTVALPEHIRRLRESELIPERLRRTGNRPRSPAPGS
jgi:uncharacterized protein